MIKEMVCINCPNGCLLSIDIETKEVKGNLCKRGAVYALNEISCPKRSLTTTVRCSLPSYPVVSVRTDGEIPKEKMMDAMKIINLFVLDTPKPIGSILIKDLGGLGANLILTTDMEK